MRRILSSQILIFFLIASFIAFLEPPAAFLNALSCTIFNPLAFSLNNVAPDLLYIFPDVPLLKEEIPLIPLVGL